MHEIRFYNTMSRKVEPFNSIKAGEVGMYTCGPTVYNFAHIGNFRAYLFEDLLRRALAFCGYKVTQVMNLTDVDDKTIRDSIKASMPLNDYTQQYKKAFFEDLKSLNIQTAEFYPAATEHVPEMIHMIQILMDKGYAYQADDKCIYFSIAKFKEYGKLAHIDMENQRAGVRINTDEYEKDSVADFALWKAYDEKDGAVKWESPWGAGRPGWHIECSAMSKKYLGDTFDIHTGGVDNMFPHHEDEIAQSESANGCTFVNYWLHNEHLIVNGTKMSKSLGNFYTVRQLLEEGWKGSELRWVLLGAHYRKKLNFSFEMLDKGRQALAKFTDLFLRLREQSASDIMTKETDFTIEEILKFFTQSIADDLNISECLAQLYAATTYFNKRIESENLGKDGAQKALDLFRKMDEFFGFLNVDSAIADAIPAAVESLMFERTEVRKAKNWARADDIRDELKALGWMIEDTPKGPRAKKI